jgi:predicted SAM-dependent methyltransferase
LEEIFREFDPRNKSAIQFAPDPLTNILRENFLNLITADLDREDVDLILDLRNLGIKNDSFDFIFASHVLEHIDDDAAVLAEVHRILKPDGIAVLPVPIVSENTIEYPEPVPTEHYHVRAAGLDYFSKYKSVFSKVILRTSRHYPARFQTYAIEDRSIYPTKSMPYRKPVLGKKHIDVVPICWK